MGRRIRSRALATPKAYPGFDGKREPTLTVVANPYCKGEKEEVTRNSRESSLSSMHARGQIDDAQLRAGEKFRRFCELKRFSSMVVDLHQGGKRDSVAAASRGTDRILLATVDLHKARIAMGEHSIGAWLVDKICAEGYSIEEAARVANYTTQRAISNIGVQFRSALDCLAVHFGYASPKHKPLSATIPEAVELSELDPVGIRFRW
jgi:hypothetical protein